MASFVTLSVPLVMNCNKSRYGVTSRRMTDIPVRDIPLQTAKRRLTDIQQADVQEASLISTDRKETQEVG